MLFVVVEALLLFVGVVGVCCCWLGRFVACRCVLLFVVGVLC